jgi:hypothetical protein
MKICEWQNAVTLKNERVQLAPNHREEARVPGPACFFYRLGLGGFLFAASALKCLNRVD